LILSFVLDFTREESALMRTLDVDLGFERLFISFSSSCASLTSIVLLSD
jgi:hypothetical protein